MKKPDPKKVQKPEGFIGIQVTKYTKDLFEKLKEEKGIPLSHIFFMGLVKALPEIAPEIDLLKLPEIEKLMKYSKFWESMKKDLEGKKYESSN